SSVLRCSGHSCAIEPFARSPRVGADHRPRRARRTLHALLLSPVSPFDHVPGRVLILCFLAAVSLYFYRDAIPCSPRLAMGAAVASAVLLEIPNASYLASFPVAYLTVWLGLRNPPGP